MYLNRAIDAPILQHARQQSTIQRHERRNEATKPQEHAVPRRRFTFSTLTFLPFRAQWVFPSYTTPPSLNQTLVVHFLSQCCSLDTITVPPFIPGGAFAHCNMESPKQMPQPASPLLPNHKSEAHETIPPPKFLPNWDEADFCTSPGSARYRVTRRRRREDETLSETLRSWLVQHQIG